MSRHEYSSAVEKMTRCLRRDNIVYMSYPVSKGTFWERTLVLNGFESALYLDIDWNRDHVWSTIMYPIDRYIKAVSTDISGFDEATQQTVFDLGPLLLQKLAVFSWHALPIWCLVGPRMYEIDWVPIDLGVVGDVDLVRTLLRHHDLDLQEQEVDTTLPEDLDHNPIHNRERVAQMLNNEIGIGNSSLYLGLTRDMDLYYSVTKRLHHWNQHWPEISWLNNTDVS